MIEIKLHPKDLTVEGHSRAAPRGQDIICSAISTLTLTLVEGLRHISQDDIDVNIRSGYVHIEWDDLSKTGKALISTWYLGCMRVSEQYPERVKIAP